MRVLLLIVVSILFAIGLVMIFNTTSAEVLDLALTKSTHQALFKQILYAFCGVGLASIAYYVGYRQLIHWSPYLLVVFSFLLLLCLIPGIGREVNGSKRWLSLLGFSFQPSEFVKYLIPGYLISRCRDFSYGDISFVDFLKLMGRVSIPMILILVEPNNGTVGVIAVTLTAFFLIAKISFKYWALPLAIIFTIGSVSAYHLPYVQGRLKVYWNPELDLKGKGHQPHQAKIAAGSGKLLGKGPGNSLQKLSYLPEAQNDYIAAIFAEEFGFTGMCTLIMLYMLLAFIGFSIAYEAADPSGFYLASCIAFLISLQAFMNLGVVSGLLPSTGLNLPFFSQGGTSLMANIMGIGILLNIKDQTEKGVLHEKHALKFRKA